MARTLSLVVRNLVFTVVVPGLGGFWAPWRILGGHYPAPAAVSWYTRLRRPATTDQDPAISPAASRRCSAG